jgi:NAD+ synthetase
VPAAGSAVVPLPELESQAWAALVTGVRDYIGKNGFPSVIIGLSGGIDSALVLAIAVDALGPNRVRTVMMQSPYTADISWIDARDMAERVGVRYDEIAIAPMFDAFRGALAGQFAGLAEDTTEENIQARVRGTLLMALSNKTGAIVLTTGNKSEMATGYCTLYGDMAGGFAVIKDVAKTLVYRLSTRSSVRRAPARSVTARFSWPRWSGSSAFAPARKTKRQLLRQVSRFEDHTYVQRSQTARTNKKRCDTLSDIAPIRASRSSVKKILRLDLRSYIVRLERVLNTCINTVLGMSRSRVFVVRNRLPEPLSPPAPAALAFKTEVSRLAVAHGSDLESSNVRLDRLYEPPTCRSFALPAPLFALT